MYRLADMDETGYHFVFIITQSAGNEQDFYRAVFKQIYESDIVSSLSKTKKGLGKLLDDMAKNIKGIELLGNKIEFTDPQKEESNFKNKVVELLEKINLGGDKLVLMIDEFPQAVENISKRISIQAALEFLQGFREILLNRKLTDKVQFLITGSIGLPPLVRKLGGTDLINLLTIQEVEPMELAEARTMLRALLDAKFVKYEPEALDVILEKIGYLMPFYVQLAAQEIVDLYEDEAQTINQVLAAQAFTNIFKSRNSTYFNEFFDRLKKHLEKEDLLFATKLLDKIADKGQLSNLEISDFASKYTLPDGYKNTVESLVYDGYLYYEPNTRSYCFTSDVLKKWWTRYA
jgi:hypothetical protein